MTGYYSLPGDCRDKACHNKVQSSNITMEDQIRQVSRQRFSPSGPRTPLTAATAAAGTAPAGLGGHSPDGSLHDAYEGVRPISELLQGLDGSQPHHCGAPGWQYKQQRAEPQPLLHPDPHQVQQPACYSVQQQQYGSTYADVQAAGAAAAAASGLAAAHAAAVGTHAGSSGLSSSSRPPQHSQQQQQQLSAVIIDDLQLDSDEDEQQQQAQQVVPCVPLNMPQDATRVLVSLPCLTPVVVQRSFEGLQLPASYLLSALAAALSSCKLMQQLKLQPDSSPGSAAQLLLPLQGCCCSVDLQLVAVAVEQHPCGSAWGRVGLVQRVSNVLQTAAVLQAEQQGAGYR
jgi:hypothetical protein